MSDLESVIEWLDPDWRSHFRCADDAAEHYQSFSPREWREAYREVTGEEWDDL